METKNSNPYTCTGKCASKRAPKYTTTASDHGCLPLYIEECLITCHTYSHFSPSDEQGDLDSRMLKRCILQILVIMSWIWAGMEMLLVRR